jgi:hypothetical protein
MDLSVQEQRHRALMAWIARILVRPGMKSGHSRHDLNQQEDTDAKKTRALFGRAHDPLSRNWRHEGEVCKEGRAIATAIFELPALITRR